MTTEPGQGVNPGQGDNDARREGPRLDEIAAWLVTEIADQAGFASDQIDVHEPLTSYGLASREAVMLTGALEDWLGRSLSPTLAFDHPTIDALAHHLAGEDVPGSAARATAVRTAVPVAVVGIGCRFPGANGTAEFWRLLRDGVDAIREVPEDRWDVEKLYDGQPDTPGRMNTKWGGFVDDVDLFDAGFFGISPREAAALDPQQRMLLEVTWEALENAGQAPDRLARSQSGVFVGISTMDYSHLRVHQPDHASRSDVYASTGNAHSIAANRISYTLDLRGPSVAVDTACSSSLVALHLAAQSLADGESDLALAGGVNVVLEPSVTVSFSRARMMASDGRCKTFDARADGYVRGEGCGVLVLKRLDDAVRDGDHVYGVVRGSAVNQDGRTASLTAPNGSAQAAVIRAALARAGVEPHQVGLVEAHGTGTALGDPIEVNSLATVLGQPSSVAPTCWVSSVKTNIGHLEAAAGVAGVIKVLLSLEHGTIPPHLHLRRVNPLIELDGTRLAIPVESQPWPRSERPRLAGVSSFGFGGTNAHVVLAEAPAAERAGSEAAAPAGSEPDSAQVLALSAHTQGALTQLARDYLAILEPAVLDAAVFADLCYTTGLLRAHHDHRLAVVARTPSEAAVGLRAFLGGVTAPGVAAGRRIAGRSTELTAPMELTAPRELAGTTVASAELDRAATLERLAARYVAGDSVDWAAVAGAGRRLVHLPRYPLQRERYWFGSSPGQPVVAGQQVVAGQRSPGGDEIGWVRGPEVHPLLGREAPLAPTAGVRMWEARLGLDGERLAYLSDHRIHGTAVLPVAAYVEMALTAAGKVFTDRPYSLEDMVLERPLALPSRSSRTVQTIVTRASDGDLDFQICSNALADNLGWMVHAHGRVRRS